MRTNLSVLEESMAFKRRKELYEAKYPGTKRGAAGGAATKAMYTGEDAGLTSNMLVSPSFATDTADKQGVDPNTIWRSLRIAEGITEEAADVVRGTPMEDHKAALLSIAKAPPGEQVAVAEGYVAKKRAATARKSQQVQVKDAADSEGVGAWAAQDTSTGSSPVLTVEEMRAMNVPVANPRKADRGDYILLGLRKMQHVVREIQPRSIKRVMRDGQRSGECRLLVEDLLQQLGEWAKYLASARGPLHPHQP
jgi:hypothetical protein